MNKTCFFFRKLKNALVGILTFFVTQAPLSADRGIELPPPPIPIDSAGKYAPKIMKIQKLLDENKLWEFYNEIRLFSKEQRENWSAIGCPREQKDGEKTLKIANEWLFYMLVKAPWIPTEEYIAREPTDRNHAPNFDNNIKAQLLDLLTGKDSYSGGGYIFFFSEGKREFELLHLEYLVVLLKAFDEKDAKYKNEFETAKKRGFDRTAVVETLSNSERDAYRKKYGRYPETAEEKYSRSMRRSSMLFESRKTSSERNYWLPKIVTTFPRNGAMVQKYIKKVGCELTPKYKKYNLTSDEMCLFLLDEYFPMTRETAYLYKGLPVEKLNSIAKRVKKIDSANSQ
jgi:hypothetical protein